MGFGKAFKSALRIGAGVMTLGLSEAVYYQPKQQAKAQNDAVNAQMKAMMEARRIASEKKPMEEAATLGFQTGADGNDLSSLGLLIEADKAKRKSTGLGTPTGGTGLGFGSI